MLAIVDPRVQARLEIARLRTAPAAQKLLEITEPPERRIMIETGVDRRGNRSELFRAFGIEKHAEPVTKEGLVLSRVRQAQRVKAGRLAWTKHRIVTAGRPQEDFRAAILVEEDRARCELL